MSRILAISVVTAVALATIALSGRADEGQAAFPGQNGKIVFVQGEINGPRNIWTMNADGTGRTQLTFGDVEVFGPTWSPDGTKIVFVQEPDPDQYQLMIMNANGSDLTAIPNTAGSSNPSFFPSGQRILFPANGDLFAIDTDGTDLENITNTPTINDGSAAISPNGLKIAATTSAQGDPTSEITIMDANGDNPLVITDDIDADVGFPQWSPDSSQVVFAASGPLAGGSNHELVLAAADGSSIQIFADPTNFDTAPNFSPDGSKLIFQNAPVGQSPDAIGTSGVNPFFTGYIVISTTNLTGRQNISGANSDDYDPDWGVVPSGATPTATTPIDTPSPSFTPTPTGEPTPSDSPEATPSPTGQPGTLIWGDNNCSGDADPVDALLALRHDAALPTNTGTCPGMGDEVEVLAASIHLWGDIDCDDTVNPVDTLKTLRFDAGLSAAQPQDCPPLGSQVQVVR